ncbi:MAG: hypothetical protein ACR2J8_00165, partial [Thermomicrobiales bacterium]
PILLVAGAPDEIDPSTAAPAGADGLIFAPIDLEQLAPSLLGAVLEWRALHPDRPWADAANFAKSAVN